MSSVNAAATNHYQHNYTSFYQAQSTSSFSVIVQDEEKVDEDVVEQAATNNVLHAPYGVMLNHDATTLTTNPANRGERNKSNFNPLIGWEKIRDIDLEIYNRSTASLILAGHTSFCKVQNSMTIGEGATFTLSKGFVLKIGSKGFELIGDTKTNYAGRLQAEEYRDFFHVLVLYANGQINDYYLGIKDKVEATREVLKRLSELGIDTTRDFSINGTLFTVRDGVLDKQSAFDAQDAAKVQRENNRTYALADEQTKAQIYRQIEYFFRNAPTDIKQAFYDIMEKTGTSPFGSGLEGTLRALAQEQDFATFGNDDIIGNTRESAIAGVNKILDRISLQLLTADGDDEIDVKMLNDEKAFYQALLTALG